MARASRPNRLEAIFALLDRASHRDGAGLTGDDRAPRLRVSGVTTILGLDHVQLVAPPGCEERPALLQRLWA
jgi:hypothetical protein